MRNLIIIPLCLVVFMLCTAESCKEKKGNKVVKKLLGTWNIQTLDITNAQGNTTNFIEGDAAGADKIKKLRIDFDKYLAQHGDLFWFATYGDESQEQLEGRYEVGTRTSKTIAITLYLDPPTKLKILPNLKTENYFYFEASTDDIKKDKFKIQSNTPFGEQEVILLEGEKF